MTPGSNSMRGLHLNVCKRRVTGIAVRIGVLSAGFLGLYLISVHNYLLFHGLVEGACVVVSAGVFVVAWNARRYVGNDFFLLLGVAFLSVALLDFLHALSYRGMGVFPDDGNIATQLWIAARFLESASFVIAFAGLGRKSMPEYVVFGGYLAAALVAVFSVLWWKTFPVCFVGDSGLTPFKIISEYVVCALLALSVFLFRRNRDRFEPSVYGKHGEGEPS